MKRFKITDFGLRDPRSVKKMFQSLTKEPSRLEIDQTSYYISKAEIIPNSITADQHDTEMSELRDGYESEMDTLKDEMIRQRNDWNKEKEELVNKINENSESELLKGLNRDYLLIYSRINELQKKTKSDYDELIALKKIAFEALKRIKG